MPMQRRSPCPSGLSVDIAPVVRLWLLRLLVPLGGHRQFIELAGFNNERLAELLDLGKWVAEPCEFDPRVVRTQLRKLHRNAERELRNSASPSHLGANVARLSELVGLSHTDCRILEFAVLVHNDRLLDDTADWLGALSSAKVFYALSVVLDLPEQDVRAALSADGILCRSGLVSVDRSGVATLRSKLNLLSDSFADQILAAETDPVGLLRGMVTAASAAQLRIADYEHIEPSLSILRRYLKRSVATGRKGVNLFLYGDPGTGKSQLARVLAEELGCELFEVASEDDEGDPVTGEARLRAFRAAQSFFTQRRALILFDEVEDVFDDGNSFSGRKSTAQTRKAWINRMLEENRVPTIWLSNSIGCLDRAFVRRFDMVIELAVPPKKQREHIIQETCSDLLDAHSVARLAEAEALAPAVVTRAATIVRVIGDELDRDGAACAVELLIGNTLQAQGHRPIRKNDPTRLPETYDPSFIHSDADLVDVTEGLLRAKTGRLCLYGPPGTGKTAYGRWLSEQMDVPLLVKRASDLMSMWVGETEKEIARAFRQAEREGAVLLIDEVENFLQDRRGAAHGWEVSLVNEMLTQMESFPSIFIASTNLMEGLDQAALRRFDLKVRFRFLRPEQTWELLRRYCLTLAIPTPSQRMKPLLAQLVTLTPGDFATVARQHRFRPIASATALLTALEAECALKERTKAAIGFVQP